MLDLMNKAALRKYMPVTGAQLPVSRPNNQHRATDPVRKYQGRMSDVIRLTHTGSMVLGICRGVS